VLPVPPVVRLYPAPLALAACFGLLTALAFSLWPLGRAARIPGGALFRDAFVPVRTRPSRPFLAAIVAVAASLTALTIVTAADRRFALWFCAAAVGTLIVFRLGGSAVMLAGHGGGGAVCGARGSAIGRAIQRRSAFDQRTATDAPVYARS